jgi:tetratricopeptide (TPR) repeat protein
VKNTTFEWGSAESKINLAPYGINEEENLLSNNKMAKVYSDKGYELFNVKKYSEALEAIEKALELNPNYEEALNNKGVIFYKQREFNKSLKVFNKVLTISHYQNAYSWYYKGLTLAEMNKFNEALKAFDKANSLKGQRYPEALIGKGIVFRRKKQFEDSLKSIEDAAKLTEDTNADTWYHKGLTLAEMSKYKEALEAFDKVISLSEQNRPEALIGKGIVFRRRKQFEDSLKSIEDAVRLTEGTNADAWYHKGLTLAKMSKYKEALEAFDKVISLSEQNRPEALIGKGIVFFKMEQFEDSLESIEEASKSSYYINADDWYQIGLNFVKMSKCKEALKAFKKAATIFSKNELYDKEIEVLKAFESLLSTDIYDQTFTFKMGIYLRNEILKIHKNLKNRIGDEALEAIQEILKTAYLYFNRVLKLDPDNYKAYYNIGLVYRYAYVIHNTFRKESEAAKDLEKTLEFYDKAIEINPNYAEALYDKGVSLFNLKQYEKSQQCFNKAIDLDPCYTSAWYYKGLAHNELKEYSKAIEAFDIAYKMKDKNGRGIKVEGKNILFDKGISYYGLKNYEKALSLFQDVNDPKPQSRALTNIGLIYYSRKEYTKALKFFNKAIEKDKKYTYAWNNKGLTLGKCGKFSEAIECFSKALDNENQKDAYAWYYMGLSYSNLKNYEKAIECFNNAIKHDDPTLLNYVGALTNKAFAFRSLGKSNFAKRYFSETIKVCDKVIVRNPTHIDAWNNKAIAFRELRKFDKSNKAFEEALILYDNKLENDPEDIDALYDKGVIYNNLKEYTKALKFFDKVINLNQEYGMAWYYKGITLYNLTHYCEAIDAFNKSINCFKIIGNKPSIHNASYNKALAYCNLKKYNGAEELFSKHFPSVNLSVQDNKEDIYYEAGFIDYNLRDYKSALNFFQKFLELNRNNPLGWYYKGIIHNSLNQYPQAITALDRALELSPDSPDIWYQKGISLFNSGKYLEAVKVFDESIKLNLDSPDVWYYRGLCFTSINSPIEAMDSFEKSIQVYNNQLEKNPEYLCGWYNKGSILYDIGRFDEARQSFKKVVQIINETKNNFIEPKLLEQKGIALFYLMEYEESVDTLKKAMELNSSDRLLPEYVDTASHLSKVVDENNKINWQRIITTDSESIVLREALWNKQILFYHSQGKYKEALKICDVAINHIPRDRVLNNKGLILSSCGEYTDAIDSFKEAAEFNYNKRKNTDKNPEIWNNLGRILYTKGEYSEAINNFEKAIELNPLYPEAWSNKGLALIELKEYDRASKSLENAIKIYPNNVLAHINLGNLFLILGNFDAAIKKANDAFRLSVNDDYTLGQAWCLKGQAQIGKSMYKSMYNSAVDSFEKAISYCPANPFLILWKSYAIYLNNELSSKSKEVKTSEHYKDIILSIIRDLERTLSYFEKPIEKRVSFLSQTSFDKSSKNNNKDIEESNITKAYTLYFLGCLYYKINDVFTAYRKLDECEKLNLKLGIQESARTLKNNIWNYQITPSVSWWNWWIYSLPHTWLKRGIFLLLAGIILKMLEFSNILLNGLSSYFENGGDELTYPVIIQFSLIIIIFVFVLLSPSIKSIKGKDIEFEMQHSTPPPFELYLCMPPFKFEKATSDATIERSSRIYSTPIEKITGQWKSIDEMK